jgi:hypothetical protein
MNDRIKSGTLGKDVSWWINELKSIRAETGCSLAEAKVIAKQRLEAALDYSRRSDGRTT